MAGGHAECERRVLTLTVLCSLTVSVDSLKPFFARAGTPPAAGPISDAGGRAQGLLNRRVVRGVVRWQGHTSADDEWRRLEELAHCPEKVVGYDAATPRLRAARRAGPVPRPRLLRPPPCPRRHHLWHAPGFGSRPRPSS